MLKFSFLVFAQILQFYILEILGRGWLPPVLRSISTPLLRILNYYWKLELCLTRNIIVYRKLQQTESVPFSYIGSIFNRTFHTYFSLFQNLLFYYDSEHCSRPSGILLLEGCYCERLITTGTASKMKDGSERQVSVNNSGKTVFPCLQNIRIWLMDLSK